MKKFVKKPKLKAHELELLKLRKQVDKVVVILKWIEGIEGRVTKLEMEDGAGHAKIIASQLRKEKSPSGLKRFKKLFSKT